MSKFKVAITDCDHDNVDVEADIFSKVGLEMKRFQCKNEDDLINQCKGINGFINQYAPLTEKVFANLPDLKFVVRYGVGVNNIDIEAASKYGVQICNVPDYGMHEVADHAMALTLSLSRKIFLMNEEVKDGKWDYQKAIPLFRYKTQTIGIIGLGRIGKEYAKRAHGFGFNVIGCEERAIDFPNFVSLVSFEDLIKNSDIISIHCPAEGNINLIGEKEFEMMKATTYIINVSRGGIINEVALDKALRNQNIAGAGLDVTALEPISKESPLLNHRNLLITPHMAWYSEESALELKRKVALETVRFATGEEVHYPVNKIN